MRPAPWNWGSCPLYLRATISKTGCLNKSSFVLNDLPDDVILGEIVSMVDCVAELPALAGDEYDNGAWESAAGLEGPGGLSAVAKH